MLEALNASTNQSDRFIASNEISRKFSEIVLIVSSKLTSEV
jgi:hypothetical protein